MSSAVDAFRLPNTHRRRLTAASGEDNKEQVEQWGEK